MVTCSFVGVKNMEKIELKIYENPDIQSPLRNSLVIAEDNQHIERSFIMAFLAVTILGKRILE